MSAKLPTIREFRELQNHQDLIELTWKQIQKDFEECGHTIHTPPLFSLKAFFNVILKTLEAITHLSTPGLQRLLYRVDLSPSDIKKMEPEFPHYSHLELLAELIIQREIKKVLIRQYFKHNPDI